MKITRAQLTQYNAGRFYLANGSIISKEEYSFLNQVKNSVYGMRNENVTLKDIKLYLDR